MPEPREQKENIYTNNSKDDESFEKKLIKEMYRNEIANNIFKDFDDRIMLHLLSRMGEHEALSYTKLKKERITAYIKSKQPSIRFKKKFLKNKKACKDIVDLWFYSILLRHKKITLSEIYERECVLIEDGPINSALKDYTTIIIEFLENKDLERAYMSIGCMLCDPIFCDIFSDLREEEFFINFKRISEKYAKKIISLIENKTEEGSYLIKYRIKNLKNKYISLSEQYKDAYDEIKNFGNLSFEQLNEDRDKIYKEFIELKNIVLKACESLHGFHSKLHNNIKNLSDIFIVLEEIDQFKKKELFKNRDLALQLLKKAGEIHLNGTQSDSHLISFLKTVEELKLQIQKNNEDIEKILSKKHPINMLLTLPEQEKTVSDQYDELAIKLKEYCGEDAGNALVLNLMLKKLHIGKIDEPKKEKEVATIKKDKKLDKAPQKHEQAEKRISKIESKEYKKKERKQKNKDTKGDTSIEEAIHFEINSKSDLIAREILEKPLKMQEEAIRELVFCLIIENKIGPAYWIANYLEDIISSYQPKLPSWLIETIGISKHLKHDLGSLSNRLASITKEFSAKIFSGTDTWNNGIALLVNGSLLRPTIIARGTGSSGILRSIQLKGKFEHTFSICKAIAEFGESGFDQSFGYFGGMIDQANWENELKELIQNTKNFSKQAKKMSLIYLPATQVWKKLQKKGKFVYELLDIVGNNKTKDIQKITELIKKYSSLQELKNLIAETDHSLRPKKAKGKMITGSGLNQIIMRINECINLARQWVVVCEKKPGKGREWLIKQVKELEKQIKQNLDLSYQELDLFQKNNPDSWCVKCGTTIFREELRKVINIFHAKEPISEERNLNIILNSDLIKIPEIRLNDDFAPIAVSGRETADKLIKLIANDENDFDSLFDSYCMSKDHEKTYIMLKYLHEITTDLNYEKYVEKRDKEIKDCLNELNNEIKATKSKIEDAVMSDLLAEDEVLKLNSEVDLISPNKIRNFPEIFSRLRNVRNQLDKKKKKRISEINNEIKILETGEKEKVRIKNLLESGDIGTAEEFIALLEAGESLPDLIDATDNFRSFFPDFTNDLYYYLVPKEGKSAPSTRKILKKLESGQDIGPLILKNRLLPSLLLKEAAETMGIWFAAKKNKKIGPHQIKRILIWLGLEINNVTEVEKRNDLQGFIVESQSVRSCPIPDYGSLAGGRYIVLCVFSRPTEEMILDLSIQYKRKGKTFVFFFGHMAEYYWRNLALEARNNGPGTLVIDDAVMLSLVSVRSSRLPLLFEYCLPFTSFNPYTPFATGNVPAEMFFGRQKEKQSLMDPLGACFIYGGRQLGKSALLRAVQREFHRPSEDQIAFFIDLKIEGLGETRPIDDIWEILSNQLVGFGIQTYQKQKGEKAENLINQILSWVAAKDTRRLLILLDEADVFLDEDANSNFEKLTKLKGLMEKSERRVKLVLAGLHNVQRFVNIPNQPLAHLGEPICVGPLLGEGEWRYARGLIEKPLSALGYRFKAQDLINRLMAHTNYQPSLIQLFCDALIRYLVDPNQKIFNAKSSPPYIIEESHVEDVYSSTNLRKNIRDRYVLTLNLDPRYRVIANVLAYGALENEETHRKGFDIPWVTQEVNHWWPLGFAESQSVDDLRGLLEEMVGLGVLTRTSQNRFRLRSPNVLRLLGTADEIEHALLTAESWELPKKFRQSIDRRAGNENKVKRSPLTGSQESDLFFRESGFRLLFGSSALGLEDVPEFLNLARPQSSKGSFKILPTKFITLKDFQGALDKYIENKKEGINILIIPQNCPFSEGWIEYTSKKVARLRSKSDILKVIFFIEPKALLNLLQDFLFLEKNIDIKSQSVYLKKWNESTIQRWLDELGIPPNSPDQREKIMEETGGWPYLINKFGELCIPKHLDWEQGLRKINQELISDTKREKFLDSVGLSKATMVREVFKSWADYGDPLTIDELSTIVDAITNSEAKVCVEYGKSLGICDYMDDNKWRISSFIQKLLLL